MVLLPAVFVKTFFVVMQLQWNVKHQTIRWQKGQH